MDDTGALSTDDLISLRRAAAMAHTVGGLTLQLRSGGRLLATVAPAVEHPHSVGAEILHPAGPPGRSEVSNPCGFRLAVGKAWADHRSGREVTFAGADTGRLDLDWSLRSPGRLVGFGGVRVACGGRLVWAMPSLLAPSELADVLGEVDDTLDPCALPADDIEARIVHDGLLDISVVHIEAQPDWPPRLIPVLDGVLVNLIAMSTASELVASTAASAA